MTLAWDTPFVLVCAAIFTVLVTVQLLLLLIYVRRRASLLLRIRPITPFLFLVFLFFRCVNSVIAEGYRWATVSLHKDSDTVSDAILFSEFFYVWALLFMACMALLIQILQQVVVKHRLEANKQALFQLTCHHPSTSSSSYSTSTRTAMMVNANAAAVIRLRHLIRFQRLLASRPLAIGVLIALFTLYLVTCVACIALYFTVITMMGESAMSIFKSGMFLALVCIPPMLFSTSGVLLLIVDAIAACIDIVRMRRNAVPWSKIGQWLLNYVIDRPHYLRLETLTVLVFPVIGVVYVASVALIDYGLHTGVSAILSWTMNLVVLLYPGGGVLIIVTLVGDLQNMRRRQAAAAGRVKNPILWQEEEEDFRTYMTRVLMSVGDGSKNAQIFLGMMQHSKKECSTEVRAKCPMFHREPWVSMCTNTQSMCLYTEHVLGSRASVHD